MLKFILSVLLLMKYLPLHAPHPEDNENSNEALEIQLPDSTVSIHVCPAELEYDVIKLQKLSKHHYELEYCLFKKQYGVGEDKLCQREVKPVFVMHKNERRNEPVECGSGKNQFLHYFGFYYCGGQDRLSILQALKTSKERNTFIKELKINHVSFEVYNVCYDISKKTVIYTSHTIQTPSFLLDPSSKEQSYPEDKISTEPFFLKPKHFLKIKQRYEAELKKPIEFRFQMVPQPMVPAFHITNYTWKKATNHYINMVPLLSGLIPLMKVINEGLKTASVRVSLRESSTEKEELIIYTTVKALSKPSRFSRIFKTTSFETFKGNIWCKFVYNSVTKEGVIIYIHNVPQKKIERRCLAENEIKCKFTEWATSIDSVEASAFIDLQFAYCCRITSAEAKNIFSKWFDIKEVLDINALIVQKR